MPQLVAAGGGAIGAGAAAGAALRVTRRAAFLALVTRLFTRDLVVAAAFALFLRAFFTAFLAVPVDFLAALRAVFFTALEAFATFFLAATFFLVAAFFTDLVALATFFAAFFATFFAVFLADFFAAGFFADAFFALDFAAISLSSGDVETTPRHSRQKQIPSLASDFMRLQVKVNQFMRRVLIIACVLFAACTPWRSDGHAEDVPCKRSWSVHARHPHDPGFFTQGLVMVGNALFESVGQYGRSAVLRVDLASGRIVHGRRLQPQFFGEGLAHVDGRLVQLTWREQTALVYDTALEPQHLLRYDGEGWGLTTIPGKDGPRLLMSDGSDVLRVLDPHTLAEQSRVAVRENGAPVRLLNELEWVDGRVLANVWHSDRVLEIDLDSGRVMAWFDFSALRAELRWPGTIPRETDLNGIALSQDGRRLLVTGKQWPRLFEIVPGACAKAH